MAHHDSSNGYGNRPNQVPGQAPSADVRGYGMGAYPQPYPGQSNVRYQQQGYAQPGAWAQGTGAYAAPQGQVYGYGYGAPQGHAPEPPKKRRRKGPIIAIIIVAVCIAVAAVVIFLMMGNQQSRRAGDIGQLDGKSPEEIQAELDRVVDEGMFNISIASVIQFASGSAAGDVRIENVPGNPYLMQVDITLDDTGQTIYSTDIIEPNHHIQTDTLDVALREGTYNATAIFHALDPETEEQVGEAAAQVTIVVMS